MTVAAVLLPLALALAPYDPPARVEQRVRAIDAALALGANEPELEHLADAVALLVIDLHETTLGRRGVPFGACAAFCRVRCGGCTLPPLERVAAAALRVWRASLVQCGRNLQRRLGYYHSGSCRRDAFADREAALVLHTMAAAWPTVAGTNAERAAWWRRWWGVRVSRRGG